MSSQEAFWLVAAAGIVVTIFKIAIDIATTPTHRSIALKAIAIARDLAPLALLTIAFWLPSGSLAWTLWSLVLMGLSLIAYTAVYWFTSTEPPSRRDTLMLVLFVGVCLFTIQLRLLSDIVLSLQGR
jgi:predicted Kef-type K+ transport protein